jgi:hypothetical protein
MIGYTLLKIDKVTKNYTLFYIHVIPGFTGSQYQLMNWNKNINMQIWEICRILIITNNSVDFFKWFRKQQQKTMH